MGDSNFPKTLYKSTRGGKILQYQGLYEQYQDEGFTVLGFPANNFAGQEPGTDSEIAAFCSTKYDVTFPLFGKIDVNGKTAHPLYNWLRDAGPGILGLNDIKWNFTKFLIARDGTSVKRYSFETEPAAMAKDIEALL